VTEIENIPLQISDDKLREILAGCEGVTKGPWESDSERTEGTYGSGDDTHEGFDAYVVYSASVDYYGKPASICDSSNSGVIAVEEDFDEDGHSAWDEHGRKNMAHVARLDPATVSSIISELLALRAKQGVR
jgi:hypothetical protein